MLRTHTCGQLRRADQGHQVTLSGWVDSYRDHGGTIFVDLRDRYGKTQVVFGPESGEGILAQARLLRSEDVVQVTGTVAPRPTGTVNPKLATGEIELRCVQLAVLNKCLNAPFAPSQQDLPGEDLRLRHRFLDLRRPAMEQTMILRSRIIKTMRDYFEEHDFIDVETPVLGRSTPEGARDYLVPSRINPGSFFALPQSPQLPGWRITAMPKNRIAEALKHSNRLGAGAKKRKGLSPDDKVHVVMKEFKRGTIHSGSGGVVKNRKQAIAIALSEAGKARKS